MNTVYIYDLHIIVPLSSLMVQLEPFFLFAYICLEPPPLLETAIK